MGLARVPLVYCSFKTLRVMAGKDPLKNPYKTVLTSFCRSKRLTQGSRHRSAVFDLVDF